MTDKLILRERRERHKPLALETIRSPAVTGESEIHTNQHSIADILGVDLRALAEMLNMVGSGRTA